METSQWCEFKAKLPLEAMRRLEDEIDRIKILANIDLENRLSDEVVAGLCLEYIVALSAETPDESVV